VIASIPSATLLGAEGRPVLVEVHVSNGLPGFTVVGLPDAACREARDRVRAALLSSGLPWPMRRVTVNLAPSGLRKSGSGLDLAMAAGVLVGSGVLPASALSGTGLVAELGLDGSLRRVPGLLSLVEALRCEQVVVPSAGAAELAVLQGRRLRPLASLRELVEVLLGRRAWPALPDQAPEGKAGSVAEDLADVAGQPVARLALEVAAAGAHHLLLVGAPGSGKTMLGRRLAGVLPRLAPEDALEVRRVHSAAGLPPPSGLERGDPPLRAPHHSVSAVALLGGGSGTLRPGEASLASGGVLLLDELGEFAPTTLDLLRQPLEEGAIRLARARASVVLPARFLLVATANPCPCGGASRSPGGCRCSTAERRRYARRFSGPLLDRFDLRVRLETPPAAEILGGRTGETTAAVAERVAAARALARARGVRANAAIADADLASLAPLERTARAELERAVEAGLLSARGLGRLWRVARTVADLDGGGRLVELRHVQAAAALRRSAEELLGPALWRR
jgi:magnesium chelatase family protein